MADVVVVSGPPFGGKSRWVEGVGSGSEALRRAPRGSEGYSRGRTMAYSEGTALTATPPV